MDGYGPGTYGERWADVYDEWTPQALGADATRAAVDSSPDMVAKLRDKEGGNGIQVTLGDFAEVPVDGSFDLIFVAFNTFFALTTPTKPYAPIAFRPTP